jgi:hypothetical protein
LADQLESKQPKKKAMREAGDPDRVSVGNQANHKRGRQSYRHVHRIIEEKATKDIRIHEKLQGSLKNHCHLSHLRTRVLAATSPGD